MAISLVAAIGERHRASFQRIPLSPLNAVLLSQTITQISTDGFPAYPEAVDLAFGPYARFGTIIKEYRNASMIYTPSEMVGTKRTGRRGIGRRQERTICTSHVERLNGTQRVFLKRLNRLTLCFSKKLDNLEAAFAMFAAYYNFCWQPREKGKSGRLRPTPATAAGLTDHVWSIEELCGNVMGLEQDRIVAERYARLRRRLFGEKQTGTL